MNYFSQENAAKRYAVGRPHFHQETIKHISQFLRLNQKLNEALDVACGTGLSTRALLNIANRIHGTDISPEMLKWATLDEQITYSVASAENLPFRKEQFSLITVSSGVHWFDINRFLDEAFRVMENKAWLVIYENYFTSEMEGVSEFNKWFPDVYLKRFPSPPRNDNYVWGKEQLAARNFYFAGEERFRNAILFTKEKLILYFTTQSNITAAIESGRYGYKEIEEWLDNELTPFFNTEDQERTIYYGNWIKYIRKRTDLNG